MTKTPTERFLDCPPLLGRLLMTILSSRAAGVPPSGTEDGRGISYDGAFLVHPQEIPRAHPPPARDDSNVIPLIGGATAVHLLLYDKTVILRRRSAPKDLKMRRLRILRCFAVFAAQHDGLVIPLSRRAGGPGLGMTPSRWTTPVNHRPMAEPL